MSFKDKYPRPCSEYCPVCKRICMNKMENHIDAAGNPQSHCCGPHWWISISTPIGTLELKGMVNP